MEAYVTLVATESYASGALVIARRLRELGSTKDIVCLTTPNISSRVRDKLSEVFTLIQVDELRSKDHENLELLGRPDLDITFTKIHLWKLTQYRKVVFLDADTLPLRNIDELFDRPAFSAAPDAGWPDCFNSGVFVAEPSESTFESLVNLSNEKGSFDGGDQGLLNTFFSTWSNSPTNRLPFTYNTTPTAQYGYAPALNEFGHSISVLHFIGQNKPWTYQRFSDGRVFTRGDASIGTKDMLQIWWDTWDKYYGRTSPYHLLSGNFDGPGFDSGFQTQPILQFDETIENAWEKQQYNPDDERRQVNPMPPLSSITISQPEWIEEKKIEQELHHEQSNTQQDNHDQHHHDQQRHPVKHEQQVNEHHETNHPDHSQQEHHHEHHHHEHHQQEQHASHKQPKTYSMIEWDPAYQDPPNTGSLAANIPDLSYYKNVWDQPELEKVDVWVAPLHHPEPEVMARPEYSHYDTKEYEASQKQFHKIYHHDKEIDHQNHQDHYQHHYQQQQQQQQEHQYNEWDQHQHDQNKEWNQHQHQQQYDHHSDNGHEAYNTWHEKNGQQNQYEHTHKEGDHSQVHQPQYHRHEYHQHDHHDNYHQDTHYQDRDQQNDYHQEHHQQAHTFHENNQNRDHHHQDHHEQYQAEHHYNEPQSHDYHDHHNHQEQHECNEHFHQEYHHHQQEQHHHSEHHEQEQSHHSENHDQEQEQHHHSEHHEQEQSHHSENHDQEHRQVVYPPVFPWEAKSNHFPPPTRIWIDEQVSEAPSPLEEENEEEEKNIPESAMYKEEEEHTHQDVYFAPVFPWETVTDHFPPPTRIWQDEQPQKAKQVEITNNERPAVVEQSRVIMKESSQRLEKEIYELQNVTSEEDYQVDILLDQPLTDEPLEEPIHFGFAIDNTSNSPSFQNKIFEFMETLEDMDEDVSVRDLIPINFKPSSRLNSGIYTPSSATSSRTHSRSNSRSSSRRASVVSSRRSSVSNVNQTRKPIMAVPPSLNITQNVQPTSKLFAAESSFYSRKTPYTSAAVTPAAGRTPEIEKQSYFDDDDVYDNEDINLAQALTVKHDFLNTSSYSLNQSIEKTRNMVSTADEWDPLKALKRLKAQSENMVLRKSLEEVLNSEVAAAAAAEVVESPELAEENIIVENRVPLFESIWDSSGPSSSKFVLSGRSSPRTPLVKTSSNISKLIQLEKDRYKQQHESLMLVQPQTAVASILEAQLELSQGHLFNETLYDNLDDEEPFELEPGPPLGQQPEPFATYYDWDVIQQSRQKLSQLLSGAVEEKSQQHEQKETILSTPTTYGGNSFKLYAEEPKPFTFYSNSYQNNFGFEETPKFVVPPDNYDWKDENEELDPVIEFAKNRLARLMGSSDPKAENAGGIENESLQGASDIPSTSFSTFMILNENTITKKEKVEEKEEKNEKEERVVVNTVKEKEDKHFISLMPEFTTSVSIARSVSNSGTVENAVEEEQKEDEKNQARYDTASLISKKSTSTNSMNSAKSILSEKTLQNEKEVISGSSIEAGQPKGLLPTEYLQLLDYTPETQSVVSDTAYTEMDHFKQDYFLEETLENTYPVVNLTVKELSPIESKSQEDKTSQTEVIEVLTDKTNLEEDVEREKEKQQKRDRGVGVIETLEIETEEEIGVEEQVYPEVFYIEIDESENDIDPSKETIVEASISVLDDSESVHNDITTKSELIGVSLEEDVHPDNANIIEETITNYKVIESTEEQNNNKRTEKVISTSLADETSEASSLKHEPHTLNPRISKLISKPIRKETTIPVIGIADKQDDEKKSITCNATKDEKHEKGLLKGKALSDEVNTSIIPSSSNQPTASISESNQVEPKPTASLSTSKSKKGKKKKSKKSK